MNRKLSIEVITYMSSKYGSQAELARQMGLTRQYINRIKNGDDELPDKYARWIEEHSEGMFYKEEMSPSLYG